MIPKEFDAITKADIDALVTNAVTERRTIEYKQQLPDNGDEGKREFLADVSSFANAGGGATGFGDCFFGLRGKDVCFNRQFLRDRTSTNDFDTIARRTNELGLMKHTSRNDLTFSKDALELGDGHHFQLWTAAAEPTSLWRAFNQ